VLPQLPAPGELREGVISVVDPGDDGEPVEVMSLRLAVMACMSGRARGIVTGPIHKARLASRGFRYPGHTEFLASLCGVDRPVMAFVGGRVRVSLVTVHLPVRAVSEALTTDLILHTLQATYRAARDHLGLPYPRIAVCGLNPHAGDEGLLGTEDTAVVAPAVRAAVREGIDARGPISAEAAFRLAVREEVDWVVAMYHDQGLVPLKALEWAKDRVVGGDRAVNWTLGLPVVRVGVDHGTADDIAGQGVADEGSMVAALALADRLTS
jgi:4-hydroxythreonine-4-phosphate dehydrogenase